MHHCLCVVNKTEPNEWLGSLIPTNKLTLPLAYMFPPLPHFKWVFIVLRNLSAQILRPQLYHVYAHESCLQSMCFVWVTWFFLLPQCLFVYQSLTEAYNLQVKGYHSDCVWKKAVFTNFVVLLFTNIKQQSSNSYLHLSVGLEVPAACLTSCTTPNFLMNY